MAAAFIANPVVAPTAQEIQEDRGFVCANPCADYYSLEDAQDIKVQCRAGAPDPTCVVPSVHDDSVYRAFTAGQEPIRWTTPVRQILENFIDRGLDDGYDIFRDMYRVIFPNIAYGYQIQFTVGDKFTRCKDTVCGYRIDTHAHQNRFVELFHISLHSESPIATLGRTRSLFSCAKYPIAGVDKGAFHYQLDADENLNRYQNDKFKKFISQNNGYFGSSPDTFAVNKDTNRRINYAIFHEYIYHRFISYWNKCVHYVRNGNSIDSVDSPWYPIPKEPRGIRVDIRDTLATITRNLTDAVQAAMPVPHQYNGENTIDILSHYEITLAIVEKLEQKIEEQRQARIAREAAVAARAARSAARAEAAAAGPSTPPASARAAESAAAGPSTPPASVAAASASTPQSSKRKQTASAASSASASLSNDPLSKRTKQDEETLTEAVELAKQKLGNAQRILKQKEAEYRSLKKGKEAASKRIAELKIEVKSAETELRTANANLLSFQQRGSMALARNRALVNNNKFVEFQRRGGRTKKNKKRGRRTKKNKKRNTRKR
jgi:hypothetical protein